MFDLRATRAGRFVEGVHGYVALLRVAASSGKASSQHWRIVTSLPGIGTTLAEFLAHAGTLTTYSSPAALAAHAGLAPTSRDSGRRQGQQVRPHRYHRGLRRVFSMSSFTALTHCPRSRAYYDKKRAEGKTHRQATAPLSRQRLNVLLACIAPRPSTSRDQKDQQMWRCVPNSRRDSASGCQPGSPGADARHRSRSWSQTGVRLLRLWSWAGRTRVRVLRVDVGHSLPPQVNPQVARLGARALVAQGIEHRFPKTGLRRCPQADDLQISYRPCCVPVASRARCDPLPKISWNVVGPVVSA
ncbi:transposase [Micromonospora sp. WMMD708]